MTVHVRLALLLLRGVGEGERCLDAVLDDEGQGSNMMRPKQLEHLRSNRHEAYGMEL